MTRNKKTINTIKECFDIILTGNKDNSCLAARKVRKLLYSSQRGKSIYQDIKNIINNVPHEYAKISEDWRQEDFVVAISVIYFLRDEKRQPDFLFPWLFQLLQHSNGIIRYAAVRMFINELGPLTVHIRVPGYKLDRLKAEQSNNILHALSISLKGLLTALWEPKYERYEYIASMPASPYKSVQMVLAELEESCGQRYL